MKKTKSILPFFWAVLCLSAVVVRYFQFNSAIDFETGFFYNDSGVIRYIYYIILAASVCGFLIISIIEKKRNVFFFRKKMSHLSETELLILSLMLILAGFSVAYTTVKNGFVNADIFDILTALLGFTGYIIAALILFFKKRAMPSVGLSFLVLSAYYVIRIINFFLENFIPISMSEYLVRLLSNILLALFWLTAGRLFIRAESRTTRIKLSVIGFSAAIMIASEIAAKLVFWFGASETMRNYLSSGETTFITTDMQTVSEGIAVFTLLMCMIKCKTDKNGEAGNF